MVSFIRHAFNIRTAAVYLPGSLGFGATTTGDTQGQSNRSITSCCSRHFLAVLRAAYGREKRDSAMRLR